MCVKIIVLFNIPTYKFKIYLEVFSTYVNEEISEETMGNVIKQIKEELKILSQVDIAAVGGLVVKLCEEKFENVTQKYIQDMYEIVVTMAKANVYFDGMGNVMKSVITRIVGKEYQKDIGLLLDEFKCR